MKLGAVLEKYALSKDQMYFYIKYGLLVPPRRNGQYIFDDAACADIEKVLELKRLGFPLKEIHRILSLYRVSHLAGANDAAELRGIYERQLAQLAARELEIKASISELREKTAAIGERISSSCIRRGVPLRMLHLLECPRCGGGLELEKVAMDQHYIYSGRLACRCGYTAEIRNGIIATENINTSRHDKPDVTRELYKDLPPSLLSLFEHSYNRLSESIGRIGTHGKVIAESYVNAWFFLHNHLNLLAPDSMLIVLDKFPETLASYKELIERQGFDTDIMYIADSSITPPLKAGCIDINIDFFAVNEHNFYYHTFWLDHLARYMKPGADAVGVYFYFENGNKSVENLLREYPESYKRNFSRKYFLECMSRGAFSLAEYEDVGYTVNSGENLGFSFHADGEKMYLMPYSAKLEN